MAFNSNSGRAEYTATSGQTIFPFVFKIFLDEDIKVYITPNGQAADDTADILTLATDYTVSIDGDSGGSITLTSGASLSDSVTLVRQLDINRLIEYQTSGDMLATTLNSDQDYQTYLIADKDSENTRFMRLSESLQGVDTVLPSPEALRLMRWNSTEDGLENVTIGDNDVFINVFNVDSMSELLSINSTLYETVNVRGYSSINDGGGGLFNYDSTIDKSTANGGTIIDPGQTLANQGNGTGIGCWVRQYSGYINALWGGVKNDGTDTFANLLNVIAIGENVFFPKGSYMITDELTTTANQYLLGEAVKDTIFEVDAATFNMAANSVIKIGSLEGGGLDKMSIRFVQPDVSTRAACNQYPAAVDTSGVTRAKFGTLRIESAWDGIDATGNTGGFYAEFLEVGALNVGLKTDGALDFFHIGHYHSWPFGIVNLPNLKDDVYYDGTTIAADIKNTDGLDIQTLSTFRGLVNCDSTFGAIGSLHLDGNDSGFTFNGGKLQIGEWYSSSASVTDFAMIVNDGDLATGAFTMRTLGLNTTPMVKVNGGNAVFGAGITTDPTYSAPLFEVAGGTLDVGNHMVNNGGNVARTEAFFKQSGGRLTLKNPRLPDIGTGSGNAVDISVSNWDDIEINALLGWGYTIPAASGTSTYKIESKNSSTPTVEFATNGDFAPAYTTQNCFTFIKGKQIHYNIYLVFDTNAYTTAAGALIIKLNNGHNAAISAPGALGSLANVTFGTSQIVAPEIAGDEIFLRSSNSGGGLGNLGAAAFPASTSNIAIRISGVYEF